MALLMLMVVALVSCGREPSSVSKGSLSANSLKAGGIAYEKFESILHDSVTDNDFTRFANDPNNYKVVIKEDSDAFTYVFFLQPYQGKPVLDGTTALRVTKKDWKVAEKARP